MYDGLSISIIISLCAKKNKMNCGSFAKSFSYLDKISLFYSLVNIFWWLHRVLAFPESFWTKEALMFVLQKWNAASDVLVGALQVKKTPKPLEWTSGLDLWTGSLDWSSGLVLWTGPLDWSSGLVLWTRLLSQTDHNSLWQMRSLPLAYFHCNTWGSELTFFFLLLLPSS